MRVALLLIATVLAACQDWPVYGGSNAHTHYSALKQITRENVSKLKVAWTFDSEDSFAGSELQCSPLMIDGVLYATTPRLKVVALDAAKGTPRWTFDPVVFDPLQRRKTPIKMRSRGLATWTDGRDRRLYVAIDHFLYAINARDGQPAPEFGTRGRIDLRENLGRDPRTQSVSMTSPGVVYQDLLITGSIVGETLPASPGDIRAFDVRTGKLRWSFHTIPHPGEFGYETWPRDAWQYIGGANNWPGMSLDEKRGLVFIPTGSAAFDFYGSNRAGDNLFANTLLALNAATGERVWHYQTIRHDVWDRDLPAPPSLIAVKHNGRDVDAVAQITKSGFVFLFDRATGAPLFPIAEREVSTAAADGEILARTQPLPLKPPAFARQVFDESLVTDRTPAARDAVLAKLRAVRSAGQFVPPSTQGTVVFPGFDGGGEWGGGTWDPETGLFYVNANEMAWILRLVDRKRATSGTGKGLYELHCASCHGAEMKGSPPEFPSLIGAGDRFTDSDLLYLIYGGSGRMPAFRNVTIEGAGAIIQYIAHGRDVTVTAGDRAPSDPIVQKYGIDGYNKFLDPDGYPAVKPPWGTLTAIDLQRGEIAWSKPLGEYPELAAKGLKNTGSENYGGSLATGGGLLFIGATVYDKKFRAFDKRSGKLLWETTLPAAGNASPITYMLNGKQYIVIAAGGGKGKRADSRATYVAFALP